MAEEKKNWENLSSDDEDTYERKPRPPVEEKKEEPKQEEEQTTEEQPKKPFHQKQRLPDKGEMIDEIKKMEQDTVSINIFKVEEKVIAKEIYAYFKDVKIAKIFKEQRAGQFTLDFDNHEHAIHFVKVAPRPMNGKKFMMRISNKKPKHNPSDWNEIGEGGRLVRIIPRHQRTGNKWQDKAPKHPQPNYNRKDVNDVFPEDTAEKSAPLKEQAPEQQEQQQYKPKKYQKEQQAEGEDQKSFQRKGFYNPNKGESKPEPKQDNDGFQTVPSRKDNQPQKEVEQKPQKQQKPKQNEDGWVQTQGNAKKQNKNIPKKQSQPQQQPKQQQQQQKPKNTFNALAGWD